jgi:hypothetical protein
MQKKGYKYKGMIIIPTNAKVINDELHIQGFHILNDRVYACNHRFELKYLVEVDIELQYLKLVADHLKSKLLVLQEEYEQINTSISSLF